MTPIDNKILMIFAVLLVMVFCADTMAFSIDSVAVVPQQPSATDAITFNISGTASASPSSVAYDLFFQNGTTLQLDLYLNAGFGQTVSYWDYSKQILPLVQGTYNLEVRAFDSYNSMLWDTYPVDFTVVPEPSTITLLGLSLPFLRIFRKEKNPKTA
jgi:hypothetical protein